MVGAEASCFAVCVGLRISSVCATFVSNSGVRMVRCLAREPEETSAMGVTLAGLGTRQQGQARGLPPTQQAHMQVGWMR